MNLNVRDEKIYAMNFIFIWLNCLSGIKYVEQGKESL